MKKVLVFGGSGLVGSRFIGLNATNVEIKSPDASTVDILNKDQIAKAIEKFNPDSVINFAAYTNVEEAENQKDDEDGIVFQVNVNGAKNVAEVCQKANKHLIHISTEYVFDGTKQNFPYTEEDKPNPINWYGQTKYLGEQAVNNIDGKSIVVRISMPYSPLYKQKKDIARFFLQQLQAGQQVQAVWDQQVTPTLVDDIVNALLVFLENQTDGIYHISSKDTTTPLDFVKTIAETFHLNYSLISSISFEEFNKNKKAKLLTNSCLNPAKFEEQFGDDILHTIEEGLQIFKNQI